MNGTEISNFFTDYTSFMKDIYNKILKHLQKTIWLIFIAAHWKYESKHFVAIFENTGLWNIGVLGKFAFLNQV